MVQKEVKDRVLEDPTKYFWLRSGRGLRSLRELANVLPSIGEEEWRYHVNEEKNDFANWIRDVFGQHRLAEALRRATSKSDFQRLLYTTLTKASIVEKQREKEKVKQERERAVINDPEAFVQYHEEDSRRKDELADRFDALARTFEENLAPEMPKEVEHRLDQLTERFEALRQQVSEARKLGKDPLFAALLLKRLQSKLAYAKTTEREEDFAKVDALLDEAEQELGAAKSETEVDVRKEVEALVAAESPDIKRSLKHSDGGWADSLQGGAA